MENHKTQLLTNHKCYMPHTVNVVRDDDLMLREHVKWSILHILYKKCSRGRLTMC